MVSGIGDELRTVLRMRRQRIHQEAAIPANPHIQITDRTNEREGRMVGGAGNRGAELTGAVNGVLTSWIAIEKLDWVAGGAVCHAS